MSRNLVIALALGSTALAAAASPADAQTKATTRKQITPYVELDQVVVADLSGDDGVTGGDDVATYTTLAAGIDASVQTARAQGQVSARYEHYFSWDDDYGDNDYLSGLAQGSYSVSRHLTLDAGALATRAHSDIRGAAPSFFLGDTRNTSQLYSLYAGPTLTGNAGPVELGASYHYGYTRVEAPDVVALGAGQPRLDRYSHSNSHVVQGSASTQPGTLAPFGISLSGGWERSDADQLDQRFENLFGRGDLLLPVSRTLAVTAGVGYQKLTISQRDPLVDSFGQVVTDDHGRYVTDPASPRRIAYNTDGLIYDAGVVWKPSPRTTLTATVAHQYGSTSYTGTLSYRPSRTVGVGVAVYDVVDTFGRQLREGLQDLPADFVTQNSSFGQQFNGCVFGAQPGVAGQGVGGCLNRIFQSISTSGYRARGVDAIVSATRGASSFGVGAGYANRHLFTPDLFLGLSAYGTEDESYYAQAFYGRRLDRVSGVDVNLYANYFESGLPGSDGVTAFGANADYTHQFGRLGTIAALGLYTYDSDDYRAVWTAQALLGARYSF